MCTEACVQSWSMSSPVASSLFTHLYGETGHTGRSHTEPSGHWLCQRTGTRSLSQGMRGNEERYAIARNLESCQKAALLQEAHKQVFTHERNSPKDLYITYTHANTYTHTKLLIWSQQWLSNRCSLPVSSYWHKKCTDLSVLQNSGRLKKLLVSK